jgi:hypothetical protein
MTLVVTYLANSPSISFMHWTHLQLLQASLKTVKLFMPQTDVIVFHEDYSAADKQAIWDVMPAVQFERVDFRGQEAWHVNHRPDGRVGVYGYCMMCRFFSGVMQSLPALQPYSHYMRLDDDNYLVAPVPAATLDRALLHDYTFSSYFEEHRRGLYDFTLAFMCREGLSLQHVPAYTSSMSPYNNFHISALAMWRHPVVTKFIAAIEAERGCVREGWTDASIHYMLTRLLGPVIGLKVYLEQQISYRHNLHCVHLGEHTAFCDDGYNKRYPWGPPACLK